MAVTVIQDACQLSEDCRKATVCVESNLALKNIDAVWDELRSESSRRLAMAWASRLGMVSPSINNMVQSPYAVNAEGMSLDTVRDSRGNSLPATDAKMRPVRYRIDYELTAPL